MSGIRVICRIRPENKVQQQQGGYCCVQYSDHTIKLRSFQRQEPTVHSFTFDRICGPQVTQVDVFQHAARPVVDGVLDGYNGTIFAYGQTGSGKTFTMQGPDIHDTQNKGIIPRMMDALFQGLIQASQTIEFSLKCSFLQIYLERIQDLLDPKKSNLQVKQEKQRGVYVKDASEVFIGSPQEMMVVMTAGQKNRSVAATRMNQRSSRSHSIFCVQVQQRDSESGSRRSGRLYFVDLAGSEKIAKTNVTGQQLEEAKMINKSLSALGNVINALTDKPGGFIPYRDSKLTRMLQESLGGNSQTTLVIACSMNSYNDKETLSTLRFGQRAKRIQNKPIINQELSAKELLKQLEIAQKEINKQSEIISNIQYHITNNYADNHDLVADIEGIIQNSFELKKTSSQSQAIVRHDSEHSLILLKQHIEIVNLNEELQKIKVQKKELEDQINFRAKEMNDYQAQIQDYQNLIQEQQASSQIQIEELQINLEKALFENQQQVLDTRKLKKVCERLRNDIILVHKEIPKQENWATVIQKSVQQALEAISQIIINSSSALSLTNTKEFPRHTRVRTLTDFPQISETSTLCDQRGTNTDDISSLLDIQDSSQQLKILLSGQRDTIDRLNQQIQSLQAQYQVNQQTLQTAKTEIQGLFGKIEAKNIQLAQSEDLCRVLQKQIEQKIRNIQQERAAVALDLKYKDEQIGELKIILQQEREQLEKLLRKDNSRDRMHDLEDRLQVLCAQRQNLFEELVQLRKQLDQRDEQLHNALQRNHKLERQLAAPRGMNMTVNRILSPRSKPTLEEPSLFNKKVMKPIRGGGGDRITFQRNNILQGTDPVVNEVASNQRKIEKITKKAGFFKNIFGDFLG